MTIFVHLFIRSVIQTVTLVTLDYHMTINIIFSAFLWPHNTVGQFVGAQTHAPRAKNWYSIKKAHGVSLICLISYR